MLELMELAKKVLVGGGSSVDLLMLKSVFQANSMMSIVGEFVYIFEGSWGSLFISGSQGYFRNDKNLSRSGEKCKTYHASYLGLPVGRKCLFFFNETL